MEKEINHDVIVCSAFLVEKISKPNGVLLFIVRGGNPQMPQTLFVGNLEEYCDFIRNM